MTLRAVVMMMMMMRVIGMNESVILWRKYTFVRCITSLYAHIKEMRSGLTVLYASEFCETIRRKIGTDDGTMGILTGAIIVPSNF